MKARCGQPSCQFCLSSRQFPSFLLVLVQIRNPEMPFHIPSEGLCYKFTTLQAGYLIDIILQLANYLLYLSVIVLHWDCASRILRGSEPLSFTLHKLCPYSFMCTVALLFFCETFRSSQISPNRPGYIPNATNVDVDCIALCYIQSQGIAIYLTINLMTARRFSQYAMATTRSIQRQVPKSPI